MFEYEPKPYFLFKLTFNRLVIQTDYKGNSNDLDNVASIGYVIYLHAFSPDPNSNGQKYRGVGLKSDTCLQLQG